MTESTCIYIEHCLNPQKQRREQFVQKTLAEMAPDWRRPFIALVDDKPVLRSDWEVTIYAEHVVVFIDAAAIPQGGGGGSNPLRLLASLAVIAFSMWAGPWAAGAMGFATTGAVASVFSGVALFGGMMLVNALIPPVTQSATSGDLPAASPTYSLQAQGNYARLDAPIPEHFGRHIVFPDFGAQPYSEAHGNEIFLYELFVVGRGRYSIDKIMIEDTAIGNFDDVEYEIIPPGGSLSLFPANVENSNEVSGQDMPTGTYVGPFTAVPEESAASYLGVDFSAPRGLYYANDSGGLDTKTVSADIEARLIADNGTAIGSWVVIRQVVYAGKTTTPQRYSEKITVSPGRYEVRVKRTDTEQTGTRYGHDLTWNGLRCYLPDTSDYGDVTMMALKMRASSQLSAQSSRKVNIIATRRLQAWNGSTWEDYADTRSISWAAAYCCKEAGLPDHRIDLDYLLYLDGVWAERGDECNGRIDSSLSFWEALTKICAAGRCKPYQQGGIVRFHRDQPQTIPVAMFSMRNIVKGSMGVQYIMPSEDTADSVKVSYFDQDVWKQRQVTAALEGSAGLSPAKVQFELVTSRKQALENGLWQAACNQRRRKIISFQTEMEGFIPSYGDLITVQHDMPAWGQGGELVDVGQGSNMVLHSADFGNAAWNVRARCSVTSTPGTAPLVYHNEAANTDWYISQSGSLVSGKTYCSSVYFKPSIGCLSAMSVYLHTTFFGENKVVSWDRSADAAVVMNGAGIAGYGLENLPGGWRRLWISAVATITSTYNYAALFWARSDYVIGSYIGNHYDPIGEGYYLWGAQLEEGSAPGAYIPTTVTARDVDMLHTSEPVEWTDGMNHYIAISRADGSVQGPFATGGNSLDDNLLIVDADEGVDVSKIYTGNAKERSRYAFGPGEAWSQKALVLAVKPRGQHLVQIEAVNEDDSVHTADQGYTMAPPQTSQLVGYTAAPIVSGLIARSMPDNADVMVLSWTPSPWAEYYLVDISSGGDDWIRIGEPSGANFTASAIYGSSTVIRVAAVGATRGPWIEVQFGSVADYMWITGDDATLMWVSGDDAQIMWS